MKNFLITFSAVLLAVVVAWFGLQYWSEKTREAQIEPFVNAALLSRGYALANDYRLMATDFWQQQGELACSNADLELPAFRPRPDESLQRVDVTACGEIKLTYDAKSGIDGGTVLMTASVVKEYMGNKLKWKCTTQDYSEIGAFMPGCVYLQAQR